MNVSELLRQHCLELERIASEPLAEAMQFPRFVAVP